MNNNEQCLDQEIFLQGKKILKCLPIGPRIKKKIIKIPLTERQSNRHEKQDGTGEPRVARTFLDAHNVILFTPVSEYSYRVARPLAWLWMCLLRLDFEFRKVLPPTHLFSFSLARSLTRFNLVPRVAKLARSSRMLQTVPRSACSMQPVLQPRVPSAVGATRLRPEETGSEDREMANAALTMGGMLRYRSLLFDRDGRFFQIIRGSWNRLTNRTI